MKNGRLKEGSFEFTYELCREAGIHVSRLYADQASRLNDAENGYAQNPKDHYLGIPDETIMEVTPDSMQFKVEPYDLYISFRDSEGISVISPEDISIQGGDSIKISASSIEATAKNKIVLSNPSTSIIVDSIVHIQG